MNRICVLFVLALTGSSLFSLSWAQNICSSNILYVDDNASGGSGCSWTEAFNSLEDALEAVNPGSPDYSDYSNITEIHVAAGTYTISTAGIELNPNVSLYGGFPNGGGTMAQRDPFASGNSTIINGNLKNRVITTIRSFIIDGFFFRNCMMEVTATDSMDFKVRRCHFSDSETGLKTYAVDTVRIEDCKFENITGGSYCINPVYQTSKVEINSCDFLNNQVNSILFIAAVKDVSLNNCNFETNLCQPVDIYSSTGNCEVINCKFIHNSNHSFGGALAIFNSFPSGVDIVNCLFEGNITSSMGGAIFSNGNEHEAFRILNCTVVGNSSGSVHGGGGIFMHDYDGGLVIENSIIWGNIARNCVYADKNQIGYFYSSAEMTIKNSCIQDSNPDDGIVYSPPSGGTVLGVIDVDPVFVQQGSWNDTYTTWTPGDYHLLNGSPCIRTGNPSTDMTLFPIDGDGNIIDLDGNPRLAKVGMNIDMGSYEHTVCLSNILYVDDDAVDNGDGCSWETAFNNLDTALKAVNFTNAGYVDYDHITEIHVAAGTYAPAGSEFRFNPKVKLYGGFPNGGGTMAQRKPLIASNATVINGNLDNLLGLTPADPAIVDGFVIDNGRLEVSQWNDLQIKNCILKNTSYANLRLSNSVKMENCIVKDNTESFVCRIGLTSTSGTAELTSCQFQNNSGNTLWIDYCKELKMFNCSFDNNQSRACYFGETENLFIENCRFRGNRSSGNGGVIDLGTVYETRNLNTRIVNCVFDGNCCVAEGGVIHKSNGGTVHILNSTFTGNRAGGSNGGAVVYGVQFGHTLNVENSIFWGNTGSGTDPNKKLFGYGNLMLNGRINVKNSCLQDANPDDGIVYVSPRGTVTDVIDDNPQFKTSGAWNSGYTVWTPGDYHLSISSPSIRTGNPSTDMTLFPVNGSGVAIDLEGNPRIAFTGENIDMGPYTCMAKRFIITLKKTDFGTVSPNRDVAVLEGNDATFSFTADSYCRLKSVLIDGVENKGAITDGNYTFQNVSADHTIEVKFEQIYYNFSGTVLDDINGTVVPGAQISIRGPVEIDRQTDSKGNFSTKMPYGTYSVTVKHECYQTRTVSVSYPFSSTTIRLDRKAQPAPEAIFTVDGRGILAPTAQETGGRTDFDTWVVIDECPDIDVEVIDLYGTGYPDKCYPSVGIKAYKWYLNDVLISGATNRLLANQSLSVGTVYKYTFEVIDDEDNSDRFTRYIVLRPCVPDYSSKHYIITEHIFEGKKYQFSGSLQSYNGGFEQIDCSVMLDIYCTCRITGAVTWDFEVVQKDKSGTIVYTFPTVSGTDLPANFPTVMQTINTQGYGKYEMTFKLDVDGETKILLYKEFDMFFPFPIILCPPYGCRTTFNYCYPFGYKIPVEKLDVNNNYNAVSQKFEQAISPTGKGISYEDGFGSIDMSTFKSVTVAGDFTLAGRIADIASIAGTLQAGIMARENNLVYGKMCFLGKYDGKTQLIIRDKMRKEVAPHIISGRDDHDCFLMTRVNGKFSFYTAKSQADTCPTIDPPGTGWGDKIEIAGTSEFMIWRGPGETGISAAGEPSSSELVFDNLRIVEKEYQLAEPAQIMNTVFSEGNLVSNWSFENVLPFFGPASQKMDLHFEGSTSAPAYSGRYFCRIEDKTDNTKTLISDKMPAQIELNGNTTRKFIISCFYRRGSSVPSSVKPAVVLYNKDGTTQRLTSFDSYTGNSGWETYLGTVDLTSNVDATSFALELVDKSITWSSGTIDFDNVQVKPDFDMDENYKTSSNPVTTITFADGLEQSFQTIKPHGGKDIVAATILDAEGRVERTLPAFTSDNIAELHKVKKDPVREMKTYFSTQDQARTYCSGTDNIALRPVLNELREQCGTTIYENSPNNRPVANLGYLASKYDDVTLDYTSDNGNDPDRRGHFLVNETVILPGQNEKTRRIAEFYNPLKQLVKTITYGESESENLISTNKTDALGWIWETTSPMGNETDGIDGDYTTKYLYNTLGKQVEIEEPDAGKKEMIYDKLGNIRFVRDGNMRSKDKFIAHKYDRLGRLICVYVINNALGKDYFNQKWADNADWPDQNAQNAEIKVKNCYDRPDVTPQGLFNAELNNTVGKLVYSCSFSGSGDVKRYYSYDYKGNITKEWLFIPGIPMQEIEYEYNLNGQIVKKTTRGKKPTGDGADGSAIVKVETYQYDELNRIKNVWSNGSKVAEYTYYSDGKVQYSSFGEETDDTRELVQAMAYRYDPRGSLVKQRQEKLSSSCYIAGGQQYYQNLNYDEYGNISSQMYRIPGQTETWRKTDYIYDHFNRLLHADFSMQGNTTSSDLDAAFRYNKDGAINSLARGARANDQSNWGSYSYESGSHRLKSISKPVIDGGKDRSASDNYVYDENGNIVEDKSTFRRIKYDYRNMPLEVIQYKDASFTEIKKISEFLYDASGKRVAKLNRRGVNE